jgi:hypothetical protein
MHLVGVTTSCLRERWVEVFLARTLRDLEEAEVRVADER